MSKILFKKLHKDAVIPKQQREGDAGYDLSSSDVHGLSSGERLLVGTGISCAIPKGYVGFLCARSGITLKQGLQVLNGPGVIDSNYRGELKVILHNTDKRTQWINQGDRIAQLVVVPIHTLGSEEVDELPDTNRGSQGFGSSGL